MTTKQQQQQHVSRFLEASLLRQAEGKLKNKRHCTVCAKEFIEKMNDEFIEKMNDEFIYFLKLAARTNSFVFLVF